MGWTSGVLVLAGAMKGFYSLCHCIQTSCRAHPVSYPMGTGHSFPRGKEVRS